MIGHHRRVPYRLLQDVPEAGAGDPDAGNLIVEGDNLEALKALLPRYAGRVDCIYIDPPYNTGNEGWAYNDNVNSPQIRAWLGEVVDAEKLSRHDRWLCMMYPRLALLRELLAETGSIWISLDDNENHHARVILDSLFGTSNFVASFVWQKVDSPNDNKISVAPDHEYLICYVKAPGGRVFSQMPDDGILDAYRVSLRRKSMAHRRLTESDVPSVSKVSTESNGSLNSRADENHSSPSSSSRMWYPPASNSRYL